MKFNLKAAFLAIVSLFLLSAPEAWAAKKVSAPADFYVPINRSELLTTSADISEVIVADPDIANVVVHGKRKVSVLGVGIGETSLRLLDANHKVIRSTNVFITYDLPALRRSLKEYLPNEKISVSMMNTRIALVGDVSSASAASSAVQIASEYVRGKLSQQEALTRTADDSAILNLMKITSGQQVLLRIKVGEVQRSAVRNLGVSLQAFETGSPNLLIGTGMGRLAPGSGSTAAFAFKQLSTPSDGFFTGAIGSKGSTGVNAAIDALERDGLMKVLAEPSLTAISGEQAEFLAGGEFPIPVPQQQGQVTIQYKPFGVALKFIPYVLSKNRIRIQVAPEVSEVSRENQATINGFIAPSIITRRASTTVELAPGEAFMIAGLLTDNVSTTIDQLPGAGEIPVLGALFRSTAYQRKETELVIAVTPYIVDPVKDSDIKMPTDDFRPAAFFESVFYGAVSAGKTERKTSLEGTTGFMTDN